MLESLLAIRFALKLLGANASAGFTSFIYNITYPFVAPFLGVFSASRIIDGSIFEWATILAMLVYWLLAVAIIKIFLMSRSVSTSEAAGKMEEQEE